MKEIPSTEDASYRIAENERLLGLDYKGSCSSAAFAYAGRRNGFDVLDYKGGASRDIFASKNNVKIIAETICPNPVIIENVGDDFKAFESITNHIEKGREYYLGIGQHAAIVRKGENEIVEYLELQWGKEASRFYELNKWELKEHFQCSKQNAEGITVLMDIQTLSKNKFESVLGYLNTLE